MTTYHATVPSLPCGRPRYRTVDLSIENLRLFIKQMALKVLNLGLESHDLVQFASNARAQAASQLVIELANFVTVDGRLDR